MNVQDLATFSRRRLEQGVSRRDFVRTTGGVLAAGATFGARVLHARPDDSRGFDQPLPIPGGSPKIGFHVYGPGLPGLDPADAEPSTITNLDGVVGLAYISGMVTRTTMSTGEKVRLPFLTSDMRFMEGVYRGVDGKPRQGTFALI